jgi:hypothetical protein
LRAAVIIIEGDIAAQPEHQRKVWSAQRNSCMISSPLFFYASDDLLAIILGCCQELLRWFERW